MMNIARIFPYSAIVDVELCRISQYLTISGIGSIIQLRKLFIRNSFFSSVGPWLGYVR